MYNTHIGNPALHMMDTASLNMTRMDFVASASGNAERHRNPCLGPSVDPP